MIINSVKMENWKCFRKSTLFVFDEGWNLITMRNGSGKTSVFQAIMFGIYGKMPTGFNFQTLKNDPDANTRVEVNFSVNGENLTAIKQFSSPNISMIVDHAGNPVAKGSRDVRAWSDAICPYSIVSALWTDSLIASSVLSHTYFQEQILGSVLADPMAITKHYQAELFQKKKMLQQLEAQIAAVPDGTTLESVESSIADLEKALKDAAVAPPSSAVRAAAAAKEAAAYLDANVDPAVPAEAMKALANLDAEKLNASIEAEKTKPTAGTGMTVAPATLSSLLDQVQKHEQHQCPLCEQRMPKERLQHLLEVLQQGVQNPELLQQMESLLDLSKQWLPEQVQKQQEYDRAKMQVQQCPNWSEVLESQKRQRDQEWNQLHELQRMRDLLLKNQNLHKQILELQENMQEEQDRKRFCEEYVKAASAQYSDQVLVLASQMLAEANDRYQQIYLYDNVFSVAKLDQDGVNLLAVSQMSNGEKTLVAVSILLAVQQVLFPEIPLLFDETFAALDHENLDQIRKMLARHHGQLFVITHDREWVQE